MYSFKNLKPYIDTTENSVECPIQDCKEMVERQRKIFKNEEAYKCPVHKIYISPSTFEYELEQENLLWYDRADEELFKKIKKVKRESRITRDNSEDALTWNVMRFLEKQDLLKGFLSELSKKNITEAELILWSYSPKEEKSWSLLNEARTEFGETMARSSEPDIIILTDKVLYIFEAKLRATNKTNPTNLSNKKKYDTGGDNLFNQIFKSDYQSVASERYELMRFWLLGSWIAHKLGLNFELHSLVRDSSEKQLKNEFGNLIIETPERKFDRITWEQIYDYILKTNNCSEKQIMIDYFKNKTVGYSNKKLIKAFNITENEYE